MLVKSINGKSPSTEDCYVAENATIVGDVSEK
jgi:carbonic anhydrase/acetyltransferase-like protein (isoleucine patch superfamily)